ncbi:MAG: type II 3-dehydroquinate dehydratase, partial [Myxococcota bacterium]
GPNLNLLGSREPEVYGQLTLAELVTMLDAHAARAGVRLVHVQSNLEGALVQAVQDAKAQGAEALIVNGAGYSHTSVALRDALIAAALPFVEVHLSNVYAREPFRHRSMLADQAVGVIAGFGAMSYSLALDALLARHA